MIATVLVVAQLSVWVSAPQSASLCTPLPLTVGVSAPGDRAPSLLAPDLRPFTIVSASVDSRLDTDAGGHVWATAEHHYLLTVDRPGTYTIPPFEARAGAAVARSRAARVTVSPSRDSTALAIVSRAALDPTAEVNFRSLVFPDTVFVGEQATFQVAVFFDDEVRERLRRNPTFYPPDLRSMLAYDLPVPKGEPPKRRAGARCYDALVFQRAVFPLVAGRHVIPPAQLSYTLPPAGFFTREETFEARTDSSALVAVDPPLQGRPEDFTGVVGELRLDASLDSTTPRVGDPLRLTVRVTGTGNVKLFPRPELILSWAGLVPAQERVRVDSGQQVVRGSKEFDWLVTPHLPGEQTIPPIRYPFFNPGRRRYEFAATQAETLRIAPGSLALAPPPVRDSAPPLPIRSELRAPAGPPLTDRAPFWVMLGLAPLSVLARAAARHRPRRAETPRARLRALARAPAPAASDVRRAFLAALARRVPLDRGATLARGALARSLRRAGVSEASAAEADAVLRALDEAAYAGTARRGSQLGARALRVFRAVDREARGASGAPPAVMAVLLAAALAVGVAGAAGAAARDAADRAFADGVTDYGAGRFAHAAERFLEAAHDAPMSADAWANAGTASWMAGDTTGAVVGWQRGVRLEPLASDLRDRLGPIAGAASGVGFVPPLPPNALAVIAAGAWLVAWGWLSRAAHVPPVARPRPVVLAGLAAAGVWLAVRVDDVLAARDLAVATSGSVLRLIPALAAEPLARLAAGEVVRVTAVDGEWARVTTNGEQDAWLERTHLVPLARD